MRIISVLFGCVLALAAVSPLRAAEATTDSQKAAASETQMPAEAQPASSVTTEKDAGEESAPAAGSEDQAVPAAAEKAGDKAAASTTIELSNKTTSSTREPLQPGAYDQNGKPMTRKEYNQAYKARMEARSTATENRLEARQSRWKKTADQ